MSAVLKEQTEELQSILRYAKPDELQSIREMHIKADGLRADVAQVRGVLGNTTRKIYELQKDAEERYRRAAARAMGETFYDNAKNSPSLSELSDEKRGLEGRITETESALEWHLAACRRAHHDLLFRCAERCAEDFMEATRTQGWCFAQLELVQAELGNSKRVVDELYWSKYFVPSSDHLTAFKGRERVENGIPALMSADRTRLKSKDMARELRRECGDMLGSAVI